MKKTLLLISSILIVGSSFAQRVFDSFEPVDPKWVTYTDYSGTLTLDIANPTLLMDSVNTSSMCGKYVRSDTMAFNFFKMIPSPSDSTWDIRGYHGPTAMKKMKMKVYSTDSAGVIELNIGIINADSTGVDSTVMSIHSQYRALTTKRNQWEEVTFNWVYYQNMALADTSINKIVLVFNPNILTSDSIATDSTAGRKDTLYFDDFTGAEFYRRPAPPVNSISSLARNGYELKQNIPNPTNGITRLDYSLKNTGTVNLTVFNMLGKTVSILVNEKKDAGRHSVNFNTSGLSKGIYYYTIRIGELTETRKMIVN